MSVLAHAFDSRFRAVLDGTNGNPRELPQREEELMITTKGVYHIGIPVNDVERAVTFYTEILGMTIAKLNKDDMGDHLNRADLRSGDSMVVLFQRPTPVEKDALKEDGA